MVSPENFSTVARASGNLRCKIRTPDRIQVTNPFGSVSAGIKESWFSGPARSPFHTAQYPFAPRADNELGAKATARSRVWSAASKLRKARWLAARLKRMLTFFGSRAPTFSHFAL